MRGEEGREEKDAAIGFCIWLHIRTISHRGRERGKQIWLLADYGEGDLRRAGISSKAV